VSSAPCGLDVREYSYAIHHFVVPTAAPDIYRVTARNKWLVTRIRYWMPAGVAGVFSLTYAPTDQTVPIADGGCVELEPNGAHREDIFVSGLGGVLIVEYWFQSRPDGYRPVIADIL
jgi:hypothetical protein